MQCITGSGTLRPAAAPARPPLPRRRLAAAAVQPERQQQDGSAAPDAPPAPQQPHPVKIELFETMGADQPAAAPGGSGDEGMLQALLSSIDFSEPMSFDGEEKTEYDPLRDGPLRYLGYANELGEAFAAWLFAGGVPLRWVLPAPLHLSLRRGLGRA